MTAPRRHLAGQVSLITRRCSERRNFLRPDAYINEVIAFEVGKGAINHGQAIYAAVAMSNHVHFAVGDSTGNRSDFMRDSMSGIARAGNRHRKRKGHFWEAGSYCDTVLLDRDAIARKLVYIWLNPVRAGLVERARDWPGFKILPEHWGKKFRIEKPGKYYGRRNPKYVEFVPQPPPEFADMSLEEVRKYFEELIKQGEEELAKERRAKGIKVKGVKAVRATNPMSAPRTKDREGGIRPRFATRDVKLLASAIGAYRGFVEEYEKQRQRWMKGTKRKIVFPAGTVALRRRSPVRCEKPRQDEPGLFKIATG